jgi:phage-related minor tail protein
MQIMEDDYLKKADFAGNADALAKLAAVEDDRRMRASRSGLDGMTRAVIDYSKGLADVAKATEAMTTKMLQGMEDALVGFVMTGKLEWKSLINSMISDIARLLIRQQLMGNVSKLIGLAGMALGGAAGGTDASMAGDYGFGPGFAAGGSVLAGKSITVGERGPEKFVPSVAGNIVPNGASGSMNVTYAPTIQIDSRSDRAQVQSDTANVVRQGQRELVDLLRRYNPGLKV